LRGLGFFWPVRCPRHRLSSVLGSSEWVSRRDAVIPSPRKLACRGWGFFGRSDAPGIVFPPCRDPPNGHHGSMP